MDNDLFQDLCKFTKNYDVYVEFNKNENTYEIKLKKIENNLNLKSDIMPGKMYLYKSPNGNLIINNNNKYSIYFKNT
tara:strand:+ start:431 stop:661 length:231 start_codon:yes stop_codon:yes gene_type:complete